MTPEDVARTEIPLSEVLPAPAGGEDTGKKPPNPPHGIGHHIKFPWAKEIKAVAIIPDFQVATHAARGVLPANYTRPDVVRCPISKPTRQSKANMSLTLGLQLATNCPFARRPWPVSSRPRAHPPRHARQDPPALPTDPDPRPH